MSTTSGDPPPTEPSGISRELRAAIRKEAIGQVSKWAVALAVGLVSFAAVGWWLYLQPRLNALVGGVPDAAILAFDRPGGCPPGWTVFEPAVSRLLVGATAGQASPPNRGANGQPLSARPYRQTGGNEGHQLTLAEMPRHSHAVQGYGGADGTRNSRGDGLYGANNTRSGEEGSSQAFSLMPPFVAVFYCVRSSG